MAAMQMMMSLIMSRFVQSYAQKTAKMGVFLKLRLLSWNGLNTSRHIEIVNNAHSNCQACENIEKIACNF